MRHPASVRTVTAPAKGAIRFEQAGIAAMNSVHSDCSPEPVPALRVVTAPKIGGYRLEEIMIALDHRADDERAKCNGAPVRALGVFYK
jgi:hypothetical protein